jgi:two-component system, OmpR family, phosphate regulon sensor histidine kinase PhoR
VTARILLKLVAGVGCLIILALVAADVLASRAAEGFFVDHLRDSLEKEGRVFLLANRAALLEPATIRSLATASSARITVVAADGTVLEDSDADPAHMENHSGRPEIRDALQGKVGSTTRLSATVGIDFLYVALPVDRQAGVSGPAVLRLAVPLLTVRSQVAVVRTRILQSALIAFLPAALLAVFVARRLAARLSGIIDQAGELARANYSARLPEGGGELGLLSRKLNETGEKLERTVLQLQTEHSELERLERVRKDFVINVSHELRTPLASIQGYTETLLDGAIHDADHNMRFLGIIRHNAERLTRLTADLLTLSRLELRTQEMRVASFRVNDLLADVVDTIRPIAAKKDIVLTHEPGPPECEVFCDSEAFYQIVSNLLDNAVKYTPEGGSIVVGSKPVSRRDGSQWIEFFVRDSGIGIPEAEQSRLFERFYRVDKARSRELGGTGLGLAIVKHLVRAHAGEIRLESHAGAGATFFFTLPVEHSQLPVETGIAQELHPPFTAS